MAQIQFRAILPKRFDARALLAEVTKEMKDLQTDTGKDFDATVSTWTHRPKFDKEFEQSDSRIRTFTGATDEIYTYVSKGTRPHVIRPRRARVLAFQGTYTAKSAPGVIQARTGGASGETVFSRGVLHPGTKARNFDKAIAQKWAGPYARRLTAAMGRAAKKSGHAI